MHDDKVFLTYNQQMRRLRNDKKMQCNGSSDKKILVRSGYFNIVNGYKSPFVSGIDSNGKHFYIRGTSINQLYAVKKFDDDLRSFLLRYITQVEEEVRTLVGYKFDECNSKGATPWYDIEAYSPNQSLQNRMNVISKAYNELSSSKLDYVKFYMDNHKSIPTWIMIKVVNFSTFIDILKYSKTDVAHSICELYEMYDMKGLLNVKLLIGSLHWMRSVRNSCAHNERVYCLCRKDRYGQEAGRINEPYIQSLGNRYLNDRGQRLMDLCVYFKYYLPKSEYKTMIKELHSMLLNLQSCIHPHAFEYVRGQIGIKQLNDLELLINLPKNEIEYNSFDK